MDATADRITQGTLQTSTGRPLPLDRTEVRATIMGPVANVELKQAFRNDTGGPIEAVYLFPLPHEASVERMSFRIGSRVVEAVVKEKEEARRAYQAAREEGRAATLLEQDRPNLFTLSVANILPDETIEVTLGYQERLGYDDGEFRFVFPMVAAEPFFGSAGDDAPPAPSSASGSVVPSGVRPPRTASGERSADVLVEIEVHAGRAIDVPRSPSHRVVVEPIPGPAGSFRARLSEGKSMPNRDFVLAYRAGREGVRAETFFQREADRMGTFLLVVTPPVTPIDDVPAAARKGSGGEATALVCINCGATLADPGALRDYPGIGPAYRCTYCGTVLSASVDRKGATVGLPRDVIFLVDRSCSMRGGSVPQARRAVRLILEALGPEDAVQVFAFDHDPLPFEPFEQERDAYVPRSRAIFDRIDAFLAANPARGGTEIEEALVRAAKLPVRPGRARLVVLVTDGAVGNDGRLLRRVPEILGADTRLYVLGVGPSVNRYLVERLARAGGGASSVLLPSEDVETVVPSFARRVRQAGPLLSKLKLTWEGAAPADVYPSPIPSLFGGQTVQLLGRFAGEGKSRLVLTGERATGEPFRQEIDVTLPEQSNALPGLERMWAKLRIDARMERLGREPTEAGEIRMEVLSLALKHRLLSPYTALIAEDSEQHTKEKARRVDVPAASDHGVDDFAALEDAPPPYGATPLVAPQAKRARRAGGAPAIGAVATGASPEPPPPGFSAPVPPSPAGGFAAPAPASAVFAPPGFAPPAPRAMAPSAMPYSPSPAPTSSDSFMGPSLSPPIPDAAARSRLAMPVAKSRSVVSRIRDFFGGKGDSSLDDDVDAPIAAVAAPSAEAVSVKEKVPEASLEAEETEPLSRRPADVAVEMKRISSTPPTTFELTPRLPAVPNHTAGSDPYPQELLAYAASKGIGELDLVFLIDETGSMGSYIEKVKARLLELIAALKAAPLCRSVRIGLVSYRDHPPQDNTFASRVVPLTDDVESIREGVLRMKAAGGGDGPESLTDGLYDVVRLGWRPRAARVVILVGDAPPHGVVPDGDGFPNGCPCGHHWYAQAECCREMGVVIHAVACMPGLANFAGGVEVFRTIARTTRGLYLPLSEARVLIPLITRVAENELDKQRIEEHIAEVVARFDAELKSAEDRERVRFVTDVLNQSGVTARALQGNEADPEAMALRFRAVRPDDVEEGIDRLRRGGRIAI